MHYTGDLKDKFINQIDPIVITDLSGVILEANDKFVEITGFSLEKLCCAHITQYEQQSGKVLNYEFQNSAVIDISGSNLLTAEGDFFTGRSACMPHDVWANPVSAVDIPDCP